MEAKFSKVVRDVISLSREEAIRLGHDYIGTEHLMLGLLREGGSMGAMLLRKLHVPFEELREAIENATRRSANFNVRNLANIPLTRQAEKVLKLTVIEAKNFKSDIVGTEHLLLAILRDDTNVATQLVARYNVNYDVVRQLLEYHLQNPTAEIPDTDDPDDDSGRIFSSGSSSRSSESKPGEKSRTPVLDNFGRDLTKMAEEGKLDPIIG